MTAIRLEPDLVEAVVTAELDQNETVGDGGLARDYHTLTDPLYERGLPEDRERSFDRIHLHFFERLGFLRLLASAWAESPDLDSGARGLLVLTARRRHEEGAVIGQDGQSVCLRILPSRFSNRERLATFLRHEFIHAADMLNPSWGYRQGAHSDRDAERFRTLWCASVDARLARRGHEPLLSQEAHRLDFDKHFAALPETRRRALFEEVWKAEQVTFARMLVIAGEVAALSSPAEKIPGAPCPLCGFPTHSWAKEIEPLVAAGIRADFPDWQAEEGACGRCVERYVLVQSSLRGVL